MSTPMNRRTEAVGMPAREDAGDGGNVQCTKKRILVVDDDPSVRGMLARVLVGESYLVWSAGNGAEALEIAAGVPIDLVLLDLNMPVKSGWDTLERLMADQPMLTVIIITDRPNQL